MTAQMTDEIFIDGARWALLATPLDPFIERIGVRFEAPHTANWRGYTASWRLDGDVLQLVDVTATVRAPSGELVEISGSEALDGVALPLAASWVTGRFYAGSGDVVRYVHAGFDSRWERELLLEFVDGRVASRQELAPPAAMGSAGPYQLHEPLLGDLSGGAFGQLVRASDLDGRPLVAKVARPRGGGGGTEMWSETPLGRFPMHLPAQAFWQRTGGGFVVEELDGAVLAEVLEREAELLERDGAVLLPRSYGMWDHDPSGASVLVMEHLEGRAPSTPGEIVAVLGALQAAVERGTFDAHGDVKREHIFIDDGTVRICDPAPRFSDPGRRAFTFLYNPRGWTGPAADVAACATILRYLPSASPAGWRWCAAVLDAPVAPAWASSHESALRELELELAHPVPTPPGWRVPPLPDWQSFAAPAHRPGGAARDDGPVGPVGDLPELPAWAPTYRPAQLPSSTLTGETVHELVARLVSDLESLASVLEWAGKARGQSGPHDPELVAELDRLALVVGRILTAGRPFGHGFAPDPP